MDSKQLNFVKGNPGLGMLIREFGGDGNCKVYGKKDKQGILKEVRIVLPWGDEENLQEEYLMGEVGVNSGQILITDPCHVLPSE